MEMEFKQESKYFFTAGACVFREITTLALRQGRKTQETAVSMATHGVATYIMDGTFWQHHKWENQVSPAPFPGETLAGLNIAFTCFLFIIITCSCFLKPDITESKQTISRSFLGIQKDRRWLCRMHGHKSILKSQRCIHLCTLSFIPSFRSHL